MDALVRDICNKDEGDADFPVSRHKDYFDGHSWASGLLQQANGKGQESSSEVSAKKRSVLVHIELLLYIVGELSTLF